MYVNNLKQSQGRRQYGEIAAGSGLEPMATRVRTCTQRSFSVAIRLVGLLGPRGEYPTWYMHGNCLKWSAHHSKKMFKKLL
jgi:hypothetical protein